MTADLAILGAGPAGMAAAALAAELGLDTVVIDEQAAPGGQIYRAVEAAPPDTPLGADYLAGQELASALRKSGARYLPKTCVWHIDAAGRLFLAVEGRVSALAAQKILIAAGAVERPVPIPDWTLPGVMGAGAAQILLKASDIVPDGRIVIAGQGPLVYLVAAQLAAAGAPPAALLLTTPFANFRRALYRPVPIWRGRTQLSRGLSLIAAVRRAQIPVRRRVRGLRAIGAGRLERVAWQGGEIAGDHLLLHEGVIPNVQPTLALGLAHQWDEAQLCWRPVLDPSGRTSHSNIWVAGDGGGIAGADAAVLSGRLAALDIARRLGRLSEAEWVGRAAPIQAAVARERALRPFLDRLYRPSYSVLVPKDDAILACRCESVPFGAVRRAARLGASGPNQMKAFTRCGMGPCQGRICGPLVAAAIADTLGKSVAEIGTLRPRAPWKPITVGALADLEIEEEGV
jgi:NADPH-dependent 2,4-dienoyl-CoA reductase/sulfur reductase-like enzyme